MELNDAINIIAASIKQSKYQCFVYEKHFCEGVFSIQLCGDTYCLYYNTESYEDLCDESTIIFCESSTEIERLLMLIYKFTKSDDIYYCRINDMIYVDEEHYNRRKLDATAALIITNQLEECSVCKEFNSIKTICKHNLCRLCFWKCCKKTFCETCEVFEMVIDCPVCRKQLKSDCIYFKP